MKQSYSSKQILFSVLTLFAFLFLGIFIAQAPQGTVPFSISSYAAGMYIMVVKKDNLILYQHKLIIK